MADDKIRLLRRASGDEPPDGTCAGCWSRHKVIENLRIELRLAEKQSARGKENTDFWRESWEQLIGDLSDLIARVRRRAKSRRFATVLDLMTLLNRQEKERGTDGK